MNANPKFTNCLIEETSPYLLQHAHNPVDWVAWSSSLFAEAQKNNKPILLSIGYSACHWCHVMERESFEDETVAAYMNANFINVKVDREERPDVDHIYMDALQAMTGSGGWPLNIFLLPNGKPFFGGTYFPPKTLPQRASWLDVLKGVSEAYTNNHEKINDQAEQLTQHLLKKNIIHQSASLASASASENGDNELPTKEELEIIGNRILQNADTMWGGFGVAPKFPQTFCLQMLFRNYKINGNESCMVHAVRSIDKMIQGGLYDHLGGGFARYSTDAQWQAPHFEKMLYDNALLIGVMAEAYQITQKDIYASIIKQTVSFLKTELSNQQGAYYAALDADSEGVEGKFYTWSYDEIEKLVDPSLFTEFCNYYQVTQNGNWEHTNILWTTEALEKSFTPEFVNAKNILFNHRSKRIRPALDYKIILSWNCLLITALCKAYAAIGDEQYKKAAIDAIVWVENNFSDNDQEHLFHTNTNGVKKSFAFLDDYGALIQSYIQLQEITGDTQYLHKAEKWMGYVQAHFLDEEGVFFYYTAQYQTDVIVRQKDTYDGAQPSGNALICMSLYYLGHVFDRANWISQSERMIHQMRKLIIQYPSSFSYWGQCFSWMAADAIELVAIGPKVHNSLKKVLSPFQPHKILVFSDKEDSGLASTIGKYSLNNQYYICVNKTCLPANEVLDDILALF
jgi:uncharacterized protein YyaL (SSP411 family)